MNNSNTNALKTVLNSMPTLSAGQADDLKIQTPQFKVWVSRLTVEDGTIENHAISIEYLDDGVWRSI
ncbi:MAG: hypothetical protein GY899_13610 [Verrucomicrobiaceae bacterium]|nr:hypothetical protein [Verrucomicrobiaceae bacterium]